MNRKLELFLESSETASGSNDKLIVRSIPRWLISASCFVLLALGVSVYFNMKPDLVDRKNITISTVFTDSFSSNKEFDARLAHNVLEVVTVRAGGYTQEVLAHDGDIVEAGSILAKISNDDIRASNINSELELLEATRSLEGAKESLKKREIQFQIDLTEHQHSLNELSLDIERKEKLLSQGYFSTVEFDKLKREKHRQMANHEIKHKTYKADLRSLHQDIASYRRKLEILKRQSNLKNEQLQNLIIRPKRKGLLTDFDLKIGQKLNAGDPIGSIIKHPSLMLEADIDEYFLNQMHINQSAYIQAHGKHIALHTAHISTLIKDGKFSVRWAFNTPEDATSLPPGKAFRIHQSLGTEKNVLQLKTGDFLKTKGGNFVFVVDQHGIATKKPVQIGRTGNGSVEIIAGLHEGDQVITSDYSLLNSYERFSIRD
ncbi:hypothetical protein [uncultured Pseudoteredinibacter sp.]|uniref:efflux RND transporter periplasmic adaptor subunit n=1 Tax=uncultured Pseudoteredinibacter sp. TaxID=1641701 RepID=UPI0026397029|nr:hypothetical protein [uncultured Pseudoteredinibacter sp.]